MKKIIFAVVLIACSNVLTAQQLYDTTQTKKNTNQLTAEAYFKKAKSQKTTAIVLGAGGAVTTIVGLAIGLHGFASGFDFRHPDEGSSQMDAGSTLMIAGLSMCAASIPFAIAGKHNAKKAKLMLGTASISPLSTNKLFSAGVAIKTFSIVIPL
jgi:hypothetical protein